MKITIFTPRPPCMGYLSRCILGPWWRRRRDYADHSHAGLLFCLGNARGFSLLGDGPPLSGGYPRRFPAAGTAAGAGAWKGRLSGLRPLGRRRADSAAWCGDRGPDSSSLESVEVSGRLGASCPSGRDAGQFRRHGSAVGQCGARSGAPHRRGRHGAERPPRRSGTSASRGEAGTATAGRRPQGVSRRRGEGGESCGVVRLQAPPLGRRPS